MWEPDPRLLEDLTLPSGLRATVRRDGLAATIAKEASKLLEALPQDPAAVFLRQESEFGLDLLRLGVTSAATGEPLLSVMCARSEAELAIRTCWLLGNKAGEPTEDSVRTRLGRLEKLDLGNLLKASKAMHEDAQWGEIVVNRERLEAHLASLPAKSAPSLRDMASDSGWSWLYAAHRLCSSAMHPGPLARVGLAVLIEEGATELSSTARLPGSSAPSPGSPTCSTRTWKPPRASPSTRWSWQWAADSSAPLRQPQRRKRGDGLPVPKDRRVIPRPLHLGSHRLVAQTGGDEASARPSPCDTAADSRLPCRWLAT